MALKSTAELIGVDDTGVCLYQWSDKVHASDPSEEVLSLSDTEQFRPVEDTAAMLEYRPATSLFLS